MKGNLNINKSYLQSCLWIGNFANYVRILKGCDYPYIVLHYQKGWMGRTPALHWVEGGIAHKSTRWCSFHTGTWFPIRASTCSRVGPWGFQRERWWLPVPCISCGGYIQALATWHFWSVGLSALLSNPGPQLCWLMVTVGASGVCTRCLTLHLAVVLCMENAQCPAKLAFCQVLAWHPFPSQPWNEGLVCVPTKNSYIQQYLLRLAVSRSFIHWKGIKQCLNLFLYIKYS